MYFREFDDMSSWRVTGRSPDSKHPYQITRFGAYEMNSILISRDSIGEVHFVTTVQECVQTPVLVRLLVVKI